jgi:anti-sigma B factor antagonist
MQHELLHIEDLGGTHEGHRVLRLRGPLLISNLFEFQSTVRANTTSFLILDLTQVPYVDSAGVGALVGAYVTHDKGRRLALVGVTERVRNTMQVAHVEQFFQFYETAQAAQDAHEPLADLSKGPGESSAREADGPGRKSSHSLVGTLAESWGDTHSPQQVTS